MAAGADGRVPAVELREGECPEDTHDARASVARYDSIVIIAFAKSVHVFLSAKIGPTYHLQVEIIPVCVGAAVLKVEVLEVAEEPGTPTHTA